MPDDRNEKERQEEWTISKDWIAMAIRDGVQQALKENWHTIKEELIDVVRQGVDRAITGVFWALILWAIGFTVLYFLGKFLWWW
jgi:hypothetical protein